MEQFDWKGMCAVVERRAAVQVPVAYGDKVKRFDDRGQVIRAAQALGLPYRVTLLSVIVGQKPLKRHVPVIPEVVPVPPKKFPPKRRTLYANNCASGRVRRTSREDID